ncbi:MAG: DUF6600 domain-containing protein [Dokdonella sp.]
MYTRLSSTQRAWRTIALACVLGVFAGSVAAQGASGDPPDRVARIGFMSGNVSFQAAGASEWAQASLNRPLGTGDKVYTDADSRVELQIGGGDIRLDQNSTFNLLNLGDNTAQIELTDGVMNLHIRRLDGGDSFEVDTPTLAFVINQPGNYRVDVAPQGTSTMVTVFNGSGNVYGENNASYSVRSGNSYRFNDSTLRDYETLDLPRADDFDRWCSSRDNRYERSVSRQYVSEGTIGYADLDDNGSWSDVPQYGNVWYPTTVAADWAPYRSGHWAWIDPWGWSWVDNAAWGFAPFHYGRWAYVGDRWGWCPGRRSSGFAIYSPAMVGFIGGGGWGANISIGGGGPVGWFPLGPRDVYVPWYPTSRSYFTNINVRNTTIINNTNITNVYNNYSNGRPINNDNYAYRTNAAAVTAVSRETFVGGRGVSTGRVQVNQNNLRNAQVVSRMSIAPTQASFSGANDRARAVPATAVLDRQVIARTAPPARPVPIAARLQAIQKNGSQPLERSQLHQIATRPAVIAQERALPSRVQVVGRGTTATPQPLPMRANAPTQRGGMNTPANPATPRTTPEAPANAGRGMRPNVEPAQRTPNARVEPTAPARNALPSARFAPHATNPAGNAERDRVTAPVRGNAVTQPQRNAPANLDNSRDNQVPARTMRAPADAVRPVERTQQTAPVRQSPAQRARDSESQQYQRPQPAQRQAPVQQREAPVQQREAPVRDYQRSAPVQREQRQAPVQQREAPVRDYQRSAPVQREQRQETVQQREAPARDYQRSAAPVQREQRQAPVQMQERQAPQQVQRAMPQQQPQQRAEPVERRAPARDDKKDKDNDH